MTSHPFFLLLFRHPASDLRIVQLGPPGNDCLGGSYFYNRNIYAVKLKPLWSKSLSGPKPSPQHCAVELLITFFCQPLLPHSTHFCPFCLHGTTKYVICYQEKFARIYVVTFSGYLDKVWASQTEFYTHSRVTSKCHGLNFTSYWQQFWGFSEVLFHFTVPVLFRHQRIAPTTVQNGKNAPSNAWLFSSTSVQCSGYPSHF